MKIVIALLVLAWRITAQNPCKDLNRKECKKKTDVCEFFKKKSFSVCCELDGICPPIPESCSDFDKSVCKAHAACKWKRNKSECIRDMSFKEHKCGTLSKKECKKADHCGFNAKMKKCCDSSDMCEKEEESCSCMEHACKTCIPCIGCLGSDEPECAACKTCDWCRPCLKSCHDPTVPVDECSCMDSCKDCLPCEKHCKDSDEAHCDGCKDCDVCRPCIKYCEDTVPKPDVDCSCPTSCKYLMEPCRACLPCFGSDHEDCKPCDTCRECAGCYEEMGCKDKPTPPTVTKPVDCSCLDKCSECSSCAKECLGSTDPACTKCDHCLPCLDCFTTCEIDK